ncbi:MAG: PAS domain S-box protein [Gammaproteobacteria bacterium]|jgi:PAS domain S-box-containing protein
MTAKTSKKALSILHLEDDASCVRKVKQKLADDGINVSIDHVNSRKDFTQQLAKKPYHIILLDDHLPDINGLEALNIIKEMQLPSSVVMLSDILDEVAIVNSISQGAVDYILKTSLERLPEVVKRIINNHRKNKTQVDFQKFFETSPDLLCSCDKEGNFINLNQAWSKILGFSQKELKAKPFIEFVVPEERADTLKKFQSLVNNNDTNGGIFTSCFSARNGDNRWLQWNVTSQMDGIAYAIVRDVTQTRQNEIRLHQEQEDLKDAIEQYKAEITKKSLIADQVQDSVVTTDLKGIITSWNKGSERVFGYTQEEIIGKHIEIIYPAKDYKIIQHEGSNILLEQGAQDFDIQMRRKSGEVFDAKLSLTVSRDNEGKVNGMVGYAVDKGTVASVAPDNVSNVNSEKQNTDHEGRLEQLVNTGPVIAYACEPKGEHKVTYISPNIEALFGLTAEQCLAQTDFFLNQAHPDDYDKIQETLNSLAEKGGYSFTHRLKTAEGEYRRVQNELRLIKDTDGNPVEVAGLLLDIDDRFNSEQQLDEEKQKSQQIQQKLHQSDVQLDEFAQQLRIAEAKLENVEKQLQEAEQKLQQAPKVEQETDSHSEESSSENIQMTVRSESVYDAIDVQIQAAMQEVERANQSKFEFLSSISHELRIALNAILGFAQVLTLDTGLNDQQKAYLDEITNSGNHILKVVANVIDLVKLETGKAELQNESINAYELVEHCIKQLEAKAQEKNLNLNVIKVDSDAPVFAYADKQRLSQVLRHTLSNAIKYSNDGATVEINCKIVHGDVCIGISNSDTNVVKAVESSAPDNLNGQEQQHGGLSSPRIELLVNNTLLELMGGTIQYVFDPEKVVEILVPEANPEHNEPQLPALLDANKGQDSPANEPESTGPAILYIEDNPANIRLVETLLTQRPKYRLVATQNPQNGLELVKRHRPSLILVDMNLPNKNGYDVLAEIRREPAGKDIPVVAVSAEGMKSDIDSALNAGFDEYLSKPVEINRFLAAVDALLSTPETDNVHKLNVN